MWTEMTAPGPTPSTAETGSIGGELPIGSPDALLAPAFAALARGDIRGAARALEEVVAAAPDLAQAYEMLGGISLGALDDYPRAVRHLENSYRPYRESGNLAAAARAAIALAQVDETSGNEPGGDADRAAALLRSLGASVRAGIYDAAGRRGFEMLSRREREVVALLAEGLSNAEIGRRLFVTPKTVEHHVTNILGRLGLRTRTEVAAWAHRTAGEG
jgi:DNA-binding CsgD family transcriptional regulator